MFKSLKGSLMNFVNSINLCGQQHNTPPQTPQRYKLGNRTIQEEHLLSEGGYGYVWQAFDVKTKEEFAVKKMLCQSPESLALAQKELEILSKLPAHENIVKFYDGIIITFEDRITKMGIFLFELCKEGSLFQYILQRKDHSLEEATILSILSQISLALLHLHAQNPPISHRDLKLENVLIKDNKFKLCDFGSSSTVQIDFSKINKSEFYQYEEIYEKNTTLMYRPPEMVDLFLRFPVTEKVDIWMLGCILYILCFYKHPFQEASKLSIINASYFIPKHTYSQELMDLLTMLLSPNPNNRPSSAILNEIMQEYNKSKKLIIKEEWLVNKENLKDKYLEMKPKNEKTKKMPINKEKSKKDFTSIKEPLVDFTNEWGEFVQADNKEIKKNTKLKYNGEFDFTFDSFKNENKQQNLNQWGSTGGSFMNNFQMNNMPLSPKMEDLDERKPAETNAIITMPYFSLVNKKI